jgi:hypothetical protein
MRDSLRDSLRDNLNLAWRQASEDSLRDNNLEMAIRDNRNVHGIETASETTASETASRDHASLISHRTARREPGRPVRA